MLGYPNICLIKHEEHTCVDFSGEFGEHQVLIFQKKKGDFTDADFEGRDFTDAD